MTVVALLPLVTVVAYVPPALVSRVTVYDVAPVTDAQDSETERAPAVAVNDWGVAGTAVAVVAVTVLAAASSMVGVFSLAGSIGINWLNAKLVHLLAAVLGWLASWPGGHSAIADPRGWFAKEPSVQLASVENACPTLVSGEGGKWLIDPGSKRAWAYTVRPFLCWHGVNLLQGVILSAGVSDRMGAAGELVQAIPVSWWAETGTAIRSPALKQWLYELEKRKEGKQFWRNGEV